MEPVPVRERIVVIDVLRGVALIGIIIANMRGFNSPMEAYRQPQLMWNSAADHLTWAFIGVFVSGKFLTLFGLLFGLGFAVQSGRADQRGEGFTAVWLRRMTALLVIGAVHAFLIWWGDILLFYAAAGYFLLLFRRQPPDRVLLWAVVLYWFPVFLSLGLTLLNLVAGGAGGGAAAGVSPAVIEHTIRIYTGGTLAAIIAERFREWTAFNSSILLQLSSITGLFLFGMYGWGKGLFTNPDRSLPVIRRTWWWWLLIGISATALFGWIKEFVQPDPRRNPVLHIAMWLAGAVGTPALSLFYATAVILVFQQSRWRQRLAPFAAVGRMALTNYLMQSVVATAIFYDWGLGFYGKVSLLPGVALALGIYGVQVIFSVWWLNRFRFGPMEWLWRAVTYGHRPPFRLNKS